MFLSKVTLAPSARLAETLLMIQKNETYAVHQLLWGLFCEQSQRQFIYRQESMPNGLPIFWVLSQVEPNHSQGLWHVQTKVFQPHFYAGQRLAFKLRANPTRWNNTTKKRHDVMMHAKYTGKQVGLTGEKLERNMHHAALQWFSERSRLDQWGIELDMTPDIEAYTQHRSKKRSGHVIAFSSVDYQGVLTVTNPSQFLTQYCQGFGRAKALGCGLMLVRGL